MPADSSEGASLGDGIWIAGAKIIYRDDSNRAAERWVVMRPPWVAYTGSRDLIPWLRDQIEADSSAGYRTLGAAQQAVEDGRRRNG